MIRGKIVMKTAKILFVISALFAAVLFADAKTDGKPDIEFAQTVYDFGSIPEDGGPVSFKFRFTNTGDAPLVILSARASCGCTRPSYPKKPVKPGETGEIKVTYLPANRPGEFAKEVTVKTNISGKKKKIRLGISGVVIPEKK